MLPERRDDAHLWDMLDAAKAITTFISGRSYEDYLNDRMLRGAVERHLEIIGEAAGRISGEVRNIHLRFRGRGSRASETSSSMNTETSKMGWFGKSLQFISPI